MITEQDLRDLMEALTPPEGSNFQALAGKTFVRDFAKAVYGGSYTFRQLRELFRNGVIKPQNGFYWIKWDSLRAG